jgi:hypothetical protein
MTLMISPPTSAQPAESSGAVFCAAHGIDEELAQRLIRDRQGRAFEPITLVVSDRPAEMAAQIELLLRPEPVGGAETLIETAGTQISDATQLQLRRRIAGSGTTERLWPFLNDLQQQLERVRIDLERQFAGLDREWQACRETLQTWRAHTMREPGVLQHLWSWVTGSGGRVALPQAIGLWNERERLHYRRQANQAARLIVSRLAHEVGSLLDHQAALTQACVQALVAARTAQGTTEPNSAFQPWTWQVHADTVAAQLVQRYGVEALLTMLLGSLTEADGAAKLQHTVHQVAAAEAERLAATVTLAEAIELEAAHAPLPEGDPLVIVGQHLLTALERQTPWRLRRGVRSRVEAVHVTTAGEPLFHLDDVSTAAYGDAIDRMGFVRLELGIASDDLQILQDGADSFVQALSQRNLYVLEDLAEAAAAQSSVAIPDAAPPSVRDGAPATPEVATMNGHIPTEHLEVT